MSLFSFDGYSEFADWCEEHGYDPDEHYDSESEPHKRNTYESFYIKKDDGTYAQVSVETNYDNGWGYGDIGQKGLTRHEEQVTITKIVYK